MDFITYRLGDIIPSSPSASSTSTASSDIVHVLKIETPRSVEIQSVNM